MDRLRHKQGARLGESTSPLLSQAGYRVWRHSRSWLTARGNRFGRPLATVTLQRGRSVRSSGSWSSPCAQPRLVFRHGEAIREHCCSVIAKRIDKTPLALTRSPGGGEGIWHPASPSAGERPAERQRGRVRGRSSVASRHKSRSTNPLQVFRRPVMTAGSPWFSMAWAEPGDMLAEPSTSGASRASGPCAFVMMSKKSEQGGRGSFTNS